MTDVAIVARNLREEMTADVWCACERVETSRARN